MSTTEKLIKARMGMLALAEQLNNVSAACRRAGISRSHYYEIKEAFEKFGAEGLAPQTKRKPRMPNQTPPELEAQILEMTERYPTYSYLRISDQLKLVGIGVSPSTVRAVWQRVGLTLRIHRLLWLEQKTAAQGGILTERQIRLLQKHRGRTDPEQHVEAPYPGYLLCQDTYFIGTIKGIGKIYMQSVVDAHCSLGFAKLYLSKVPMTAVDVLDDRVLPFYEEHAAEVEHLLTDNGREYCGRELKHHFELFWLSARSGIAAPRSARPRPTASANASTAPLRKSSSPQRSAKRSIKAWRSCSRTWIGISIFTTASAPIAAIALRAGHPIRPS